MVCDCELLLGLLIDRWVGQVAFSGNWVKMFYLQHCIPGLFRLFWAHPFRSVMFAESVFECIPFADNDIHNVEINSSIVI